MTAIADPKNLLLRDNAVPKDLEAERMILGCMLLTPSVTEQAWTMVEGSDFFLDSHRILFSAMTDMYQREMSINPVSLADRLREDGHLERVGGPAQIATLFDGVPRFSDISSYAQIVKKTSTLRRFQKLGAWLTEAIAGGATDIDQIGNEIISNTEMVMSGRQYQDLVSSDTAATKTIEALEKRWKSGRIVAGLRSGYSHIDSITHGFRPGKFYIFAAAPGMGKTTLMLNVANFIAEDPNALESGDRAVVLMISLEMDTEELTIRALCTKTQIDSDRILRGTLTREEKMRIREAADAMRYLPMEYVEGFDQSTASSIRQAALRTKQKYGRLDAVFVDYLQLMDSDSWSENDNIRLTKISRGLKQLTLKMKIPVIALSQLSRNSRRENREPELTDLRGSGSIEQDADCVIFIHKPNDDENDNQHLVLIKKNRGGKTGKVPMIFQKQISRFVQGEW